MSGAKAIKIALFAVVLPVVTFISILVFMGHREPMVIARTLTQSPQLADYGAVASFSMIERSGRAMTLEELKGSPWVASFMFTQCAGQCPTMNFKIMGLQGKLPGDTKIISFSVDPENDTPAVLSRYAKQFNPDPERWFFLTGEKPEIDSLLKSFHVNSSDDPMLHSLRLVLIDGEGRIRGYYNTGEDEALGKLLSDLSLIRKEGLS
ncbi:MAG TPA: SCO family protein [Candidatus Omnitrophota bacterium]|nr:SCO family protein [Candidatus Omnitrophota bacterium]